MTTDTVGKLLERVAQELGWQVAGTENVNEVREMLEERLGPLLRAGQAMRNAYPVVTQFDVNAWDAALATLEGRE